MWLSIFSVILLSLFLSFPHSNTCFARDYSIYAITQNVPMGEENEVIKKNYFIDFGTQQGAKPGAVLEVYRIFSQYNPYDNNKRYQYQVKVGDIKITHVEENSSIAEMLRINGKEIHPHLEFKNFMIGDRLDIKIDE